MRWSGRSGGGAVLGFEHLADLVSAVAIQSDLYKRPHHDAHHLPEKAASLDPDNELRTACAQLTNVNGSDRAPSAMPRTRKRREIMFADEHLCRFAHCLDIQSLPTMPCQVGKKDWPIRRVPDEVLVSL